MNYNIYFDIACILVNSMLVLTIYLRRSYPTRRDMIYKAMLWLNLVAAISDIASVYMMAVPEQYPLSMLYLVNMMYVAAHTVTAIVFLFYVILIVRGGFCNRAERLIWQLILLLDVVFILTTPLTKGVLYFDESLHYQHGTLMLVLYGFCALSMVYALVLFIRYRHKMKQYQMVSNVIYLSLMMGAVLFQFNFSHILIEPFFTAVALLMMNMALDNPERYFHPESYCFNQLAFDDRLGRRLQSRAESVIVAFAFDDVSVFRSRYGEDAYNRVVERTIADCHRLFGQRRVFYLSNGAFAIDLSGADEYIAVEEIDEAVGREFEVNQSYLSFQTHFCILKHPGVVTTVSDANDAITDALFGAYQKSGQRVLYLNSDMLGAKRREAHVIHTLRSAIVNDGFDVFYQPLYHRPTGRYLSAEALVRLKREPDEPFIGPDEFIPIAEKNGLILDIGEIVFRKVCALWRDARLSACGLEYVEVNLSRLQLLDEGSVRRLEEICAEYGLSPHSFNLEITETAYVSEEEKETVTRCVEYLRGKGFHFSLDDYGSGYATASYFAEMPFRIVKIDKGILWKAMRERSFRTVLENSISLVKAFGRECVAEGVETEKMADLLTELGCDFFQGYLYSRPIPAAEFVDFLNAHRSETSPEYIG